MVGESSRLLPKVSLSDSKNDRLLLEMKDTSAVVLAEEISPVDMNDGDALREESIRDKSLGDDC